MRHMDMGTLRRLVEQNIQPKLGGFIGSEKVNVAELNESLKRLEAKRSKNTLNQPPQMSGGLIKVLLF
jgi:hypothetical protein